MRERRVSLAIGLLFFIFEEDIRLINTILEKTICFSCSDNIVYGLNNYARASRAMRQVKRFVVFALIAIAFPYVNRARVFEMVKRLIIITRK
jgi:hypothetical protein